MTDEREALEKHAAEYHERPLKPCCVSALDAYVAAERLDEHVKTCEECGPEFADPYCEDAPIKEQPGS